MAMCNDVMFREVAYICLFVCLFVCLFEHNALFRKKVLRFS
uniref:Uncharacterized protein n=1 Tax=Anguilla anguilla TaxID=7936 RepID=A0A0E9RNE2_ANGAN